jgi:hypothetical protein
LQLLTMASQTSTKSFRSDTSPPVTSTQTKPFERWKKRWISSRRSSSRGFICQMLHVWHA